MKNNIRFHVILVLVLGLVSINANAALVDRGGGLIYDTDLNITWLSDASYSAGSSYDASSIYNSGWYYTNPPVNNMGIMSWYVANDWAANLSYFDSVRNVTYTDWRLPTTLQPDPNCTDEHIDVTRNVVLDIGFNCTGSEMGHLFYNELGGVAEQNIMLFHNANFDLFTNINGYIDGYWSSTVSLPSISESFYFGFNRGFQYSVGMGDIQSAWAVRDGDVAAVPIPAAFWLFGSGLLGLLGLMRRRRT